MNQPDEKETLRRIVYLLGQTKAVAEEALGKEKHLCNLCGLPCWVDHPGVPDSVDTETNMGLIGAEVSGGYESTPGNGYGALDDLVTYSFSLCEFCLDWLFRRCVIPPTTNQTEEVFVGAADRVALDAWRKKKSVFYDEEMRRNGARNAYQKEPDTENQEKP